MQFYAGIALLFFIFKQRSLYLAIELCFLVTLWIATKILDTFQPHFVLLLVFNWRELIVPRMTSFGIVEHFDVSENVLSCFIAVFIYLSFDLFSLQKLKETLCNCIVVTVSSSAHTGFQTMKFQKVIPIMTGELAALIGMNRDRLLRLSSPYRHE